MTLWVPAIVVPEFISSATLVNILLVSQSPSNPLCSIRNVCFCTMCIIVSEKPVTGRGLLLLSLLLFQTFDANEDRYTVVSHDLDPPIKARYLRIIPEEWHSLIALRAEYYGCKTSEIFWQYSLGFNFIRHY